jgi:hypothetical protein
MHPAAHARCRYTLPFALACAFLSLTGPARTFADVAPVPDYAYWFAAAQTKVYPTTVAPPTAVLASDDTTTPMLAVSAARSEFEGRQLVIRALGARLQDVWIQPSALTLVGTEGAPPASIPAQDISVFKVGYVRIVHPSYGYKRTGLEPDPLLPMTLANDQRLGWRADGDPDLALRGVPADTTQPFYVLFEVPKDAVAGTYTGSLTITASDTDGVPARTVTIPVSFDVYPFSVERRTLKTAFRFDAPRARRANSASQSWLWADPFPALADARVPERTNYALDQINGWLSFMSDHRIASQSMPPAWQGHPDADGRVTPRQDVLSDYLGTGAATTLAGDRLAFNAVRLPEYDGSSFVANPFASSRATRLAANYYRTMFGALGDNASKAYVYPIDEPSASERAFTQKYAAFVHRTIPGAKFLLTTDATTQRGRLVSGVDIYVYRLHFIFRDAAYVGKMRAAHKEVWIYSHRTDWQKVTPMYLIDKPLADSRVQGWFAFKARATGLLYYSIDRWRKATSDTVRDPYTDPLTINDRNVKTGGRLYANGDGSLVYPGYYPRLGLVVEGAPPVGSLRTEALRDGIEDYEYVKLVAARYGTSAADAFVAGIIGPVPARRAGILRFPKYKQSAAPYEDVRAAMAAALSQ